LGHVEGTAENAAVLGMEAEGFEPSSAAFHYPRFET
jgi:hypothetical protein